MTPIKKHKIIIFGLFVIYFLFEIEFGPSICASQGDFIDIEGYEKVQIEKENIYLGDLWQIKGQNLFAVEKLKNIFIGKSPLPGISRKIGINYINIRLRQNDVNFTHLRIRSPKEIEVTMRYAKISKEEIKKLVVERLPTFFPFTKDQAKIKGIMVSNDVVLSTKDFTCTVLPPINTNFLGQIPLSVIFYVNGKYEKRVYATLDVELIASVVVAMRPLKKGHTITDVDIKLIQMDLANLPSNCIIKSEDALGKRVNHFIDAGTVLRTDLIVSPPMVSRRDIVLMIAETKDFRITAVGESIEKGNKGDRIKVMNLDSNEEVYARIIDSKTVQVDF